MMVSFFPPADLEMSGYGPHHFDKIDVSAGNVGIYRPDNFHDVRQPRQLNGAITAGFHSMAREQRKNGVHYNFETAEINYVTMEFEHGYKGWISTTYTINLTATLIDGTTRKYAFKATLNRKADWVGEEYREV
jgi:hypothetical protein